MHHWPLCPTYARTAGAVLLLSVLFAPARAPAAVAADAPMSTVVCERYRWCGLPKAPVGDWYLGAPQVGGRDRLDAWTVWAVDGGTLMLRAEKGARTVDVLLRQASGQTRLLRLIPVEPQIGPPEPETRID